MHDYKKPKEKRGDPITLLQFEHNEQIYRQHKLNQKCLKETNNNVD